MNKDEIIQTQQEEIEKNKKLFNIQEKRKWQLLQRKDKELEKKDKIIDLMATYIGEIDVSEDLCNDDICDEGNNCNKCIKEYFINKVEKEN